MRFSFASLHYKIRMRRIAINRHEVFFVHFVHENIGLVWFKACFRDI